MRNRKYELNILLNQNTRIELSVRYKTEYPNREKSFSEFMEDVIINGLTKNEDYVKKNEEGLMILCKE